MPRLGDCVAMIFVSQISITCLKLWQTVRNQFAIHVRTLSRVRKSICKTVANSSHPSEIGA